MGTRGTRVFVLLSFALKVSSIIFLFIKQYIFLFRYKAFHKTNTTQKELLRLVYSIMRKSLAKLSIWSNPPTICYYCLSLNFARLFLTTELMDLHNSFFDRSGLLISSLGEISFNPQSLGFCQNICFCLVITYSR